jgi:G3E family GTPase
VAKLWFILVGGHYFMAQGTKIPVTVLTGALGSGKTTLLNRVLRPPPSGQAPRIAVVLNEPGTTVLEHKQVRRIGNGVSVLASGCACCSVQGELVDALRELFMAALHRKIPVFSRVLIEAAGTADPVPIMHMLQYQAFLRERYAYEGSICVVDAEHGLEQLQHRPEATRQASLADLLVIGKADLAAPDGLEQIEQAIRAVNQQAPIYSSLALPPLDELLAKAAAGTGVQRRHKGAKLLALPVV